MVTPGMPTAWTVPPGPTTSSACWSESPEPTQSTTSAAPPVRRSSTTHEPLRLRSTRASSWGSQTTSAPSSRASCFWWGCLAAATMVVPGARAASAAMVRRPRVPEPMTATSLPRPPSPIWRAAWTAQASGSTSTAASSLSSAGTSTSWDSWATNRVDQPPPVDSQKPVWRPGSRWPKATRSQRLGWPPAHWAQAGSMPRTAQVRIGTTTTRRSSSRSPTTSWPGTKGNDTMGSK